MPISKIIAPPMHAAIQFTSPSNYLFPGSHFNFFLCQSTSCFRGVRKPIFRIELLTMNPTHIHSHITLTHVPRNPALNIVHRPRPLHLSLALTSRTHTQTGFTVSRRLNAICSIPGLKTCAHNGKFNFFV